MRGKNILNGQISQSVDRVNSLFVVLAATQERVVFPPLIRGVKQIRSRKTGGRERRKRRRKRRRRWRRRKNFVVVHHAVMPGALWRKHAILNEAKSVREWSILQKLLEIGRFFVCHVNCNADRARIHKRKSTGTPAIDGAYATSKTNAPAWNMRKGRGKLRSLRDYRDIKTIGGRGEDYNGRLAIKRTWRRMKLVKNTSISLI